MSRAKRRARAEEDERKTPRHGDAETRRQNPRVPVRPRPRARICSACGAEIERESAKFCRICGKHLLEEYQPLDTLRASYRLQGKNFQFEKSDERGAENLFAENKNSASATAAAFLVYSLVPYLEFCFVRARL
jgi:hypothetical protein